MSLVVDHKSTEPNLSEPMDPYDNTVVGDMELPITNLPSPLKGPLVWSGADFPQEHNYALQLDEEDIAEIDLALQNFKSLGLDGDEVSRENFPLPKLAARLENEAELIHEGRGFFVVRGLGGRGYSIEDSVMIYLGISSYVGDKRGFQDRKGNMLAHVTNSKLWKVPIELRHGIHSSLALPYHNDMGCDILALQVRYGAQNGGNTYITSIWTVFNELLAKDPSVARTLLTPNWPVQVSGRAAKYYLAPAISLHESKLMASMDPNRFGPHRSAESSEIPTLTASQLHALETVSKTARQNELRLQLRTGDLLFFNNWALLHRRDSYTDDDANSRHMVRLWLRNSQLGWAIPESFMPPWQAAFGEDTKARTRLYPLIPTPEYKAPKYSAGSAAFVIEDSEASDDE